MDTDKWIKLHRYLPKSYANGPGARAVVWVQGCSLRCPGCYNPETHSFGDGQWVLISDIVDWIVKSGTGIEGVTISGGEPIDQAVSVASLLKGIKAKSDLSIIVFSGYTFEELNELCNKNNNKFILKGKDGCIENAVDVIFKLSDVLIAGRYDEKRRLAKGLRGSDNKTIHLLTTRYSMEDIIKVPVAEVIIGEDGSVLFSGIDPLDLKRGLSH